MTEVGELEEEAGHVKHDQSAHGCRRTGAKQNQSIMMEDKNTYTDNTRIENTIHKIQTLLRAIWSGYDPSKKYSVQHTLPEFERHDKHERDLRVRIRLFESKVPNGKYGTATGKLKSKT